jgi:hypothetical protein
MSQVISIKKYFLPFNKEEENIVMRLHIWDPGIDWLIDVMIKKLKTKNSRTCSHGQ